MVSSVCWIACMTGALWAKWGECDISHGAWHKREAQDEGKKKWSFIFFSSPRLELRAHVALRVKYRVRPTCLIKHLSCRLSVQGTYIRPLPLFCYDYGWHVSGIVCRFMLNEGTYCSYAWKWLSIIIIIKLLFLFDLFSFPSLGFHMILHLLVP